MEQYLWLVILLALILIVSIIWSAWSLRDLKAPTHEYPKFEKKIQKAISGVIHLPSKKRN